MGNSANSGAYSYRPLLVIAFAVLLLAAFAGWSYSRVISANALKAHTYRVLYEISKFDILMGSAQGLSLCVATGDGRLAEPKGWERMLDAQITKLRQLTQDNPSQQLLISKLGEISNQWRTKYVEPIQNRCEIARTGNPDRNMAFSMASIAAYYRGQMESLIGQFETNELALLAEREADVRESQLISSALLLMGLVSVIVLILLFVRAQLRNTHTLRILNAALEEKMEQQAQTQALLQASETRAHAIIHNVSDAIVTMDRHGVIQSFNESAESIFGYSANNIVNQSILMLFPESESAMLSNYFFERKSEETEAEPDAKIRECFARHHNGRLFPVELSLNEMRLDGQLYLIGVMRDITERRRIETMKNEFVSTVSHELRTPLTAIRGALGLISGAMSAQLPAQMKNLVEIALNNSERLVRLINDILDIEKIESGSMRFDIHRLELAPLIEQAVQANQAYADQYQVSIKIEQPLPNSIVKADADRVMQLMANLLSNAAKFSPAGSDVVVRVIEESGFARISVTDRGRGIPLEFQSKMFQKFSQADSSDTRVKGGTGLGLSICKAIVEHMGGSIGFNTTAGAGTTMFFTLPLAEAAALPELALATATGPRLLVCEDDIDIAQLLRLILEQAGYQVDVASSADQALTMLLEGEYVAMTLDIALPGKDGTTLLKELFANEKTRYLRVVVVSAKATEAYAQMGNTELGDFMVIDWIDKPIDQPRLLKSIGAASSNKSGPLRILHVEDDPDIQAIIQNMFIDECELMAASSLAEAKRHCLQTSFDAIILDIGLPDGSGLELLPYLAEKGITTPVIVFSAMELSQRQQRDVSAALIKSRVSDQQLLQTILGLARQSRASHTSTIENTTP